MSSNMSVPASEGCWRNECGSEGKRHVQEPAVNTYLLLGFLTCAVLSLWFLSVNMAPDSRIPNIFCVGQQVTVTFAY